MSDHHKPIIPKSAKKEDKTSCIHRSGIHPVNPQGHVDITAMIRSLQRAEGLVDCFQRGLADCDQLECAWRQYCLEKPTGTSTRK